MREQRLLLVRHRADTIERIDALLPYLGDSPHTACLGQISRAAVVRLCARLGLNLLESERLEREAADVVAS